MKISVIIPVRDLGEKIVKCLDSVAAQDFDKNEYEVLISFDSCTDNSEQIVNEWHTAHSDVNMHCYKCGCKCPGGARNVGLDNAVGEYVMFIDGDDWLINTSAMTILYNAVQGHKAVRVTDHEVGGNMVKYSERPTLWLYFFSRELIGDDRFTDMLLCEDYEFVTRITSKSSYDEATVNEPLYFYNYDNERMLERIKTVIAESRKREAEGKSPLYVCDGFIPESAKSKLKRWRS